MSRVETACLIADYYRKRHESEPHATLKMIAEQIGKSERAVRFLTKELQERGMLARKDGKRNGAWKVLL